MIARRLLRTVALAIAVLAAVDPSCARSRPVPPLVALLDGPTASDAARLDAFARAIGARARVVRGWLPAAEALVVAGDDVPEALRREAAPAPVFVLPPSRESPSLRWRALAAPARGRVGERLPVAVQVALVAGAGDSLAIAVRQDGVLLARAVHPLAPGAATVRHAIPVVAADTGALVLDVAATLTASGRSVAGTVLVHAHATPVRVLHHDVRPTWQGTFVRRALEGDARLAVTSRVAVSRAEGAAITRTSGAPPSLTALPDAPAADASPPNAWTPDAAAADAAVPEVVVVGAADALASAEVAALDRWVRRGGSAVLLLDAPPEDPVQRWLGVARWALLDRAQASSARPAPTGDGLPDDTATSSRAALVGRRWLVPTVAATRAPPPAAEPWLVLPDADTSAREPAARPVVWSRALGRGTVVVAGALDAWVARAPSQSGFATVWPRVVVEAAARRAPGVVLAVRPAVAAPGRRREAELVVATAEAAAAPWRLGGTPAGDLAGDLSGAPAGSHGDLPSLRPDGPGRWRATWRADATPARVVASTALAREAAGARGAADALVRTRADAVPVAPWPAPVLRALAAWSGGRVLDAERPGAAADTLLSVLAPPRRTVPWHPMRSPWWLLPFVAALCGEWWLRRRAGQA